MKAQQDRQHARRWLSATPSILGHPLILLLVGALLTSILVPSCTRNWQQYEKELEVKRELVQKTSRSAGTFLQASEEAQTLNLVALHSEGAPEPQYAARLNERWEVEGQVLGFEIQLYFPDTGLSERWSKFVLAAQETYELFTLGEDREGRGDHLDEIGNALGLPSEVREELSILARPPEQIRRLVRAGLRPLAPRYFEATYTLIELIERERAEIVQALLQSRSAL